MHFSIIAAIDADRGIGLNGMIPWRLPSDMAFFRTTTIAAPGRPPNAVIMGRRTWMSLPKQFQPLPNRVNVVLTSKSNLLMPPEVFIAANLTDAMHRIARQGHIGDVFVIGGAAVYETAILHPDCDTLLLTEIESRFSCDVFFPPIPDFFHEISRSPKQEENGLVFSFVTYRRRGAEHA